MTRNDSVIWACLATCTLLVTSGCSDPTDIPVGRRDGQAVAKLRERLDEGGGGGGGAAVVTEKRTGWGNLRGFIKATGPVTASPLSVSKDTNVCSPGGQPILSEQVVTGPNGELANVAIYLTGAMGADWEHPDYAADATAEVIFDQKRCIFLSHVFVFRETQTVRIINSDGVNHNTNIASPTGDVNEFNETIAGNSYGKYEPGGNSATPSPVNCSIHPWMTAYMLSRPNPYFAVTDKEGKFSIANLPSGVNLEFTVWHEATKMGDATSVKLNGEDIPLSRGKFTVKLEDSTPEALKESVLEVVVEAGNFGS